MSEFYRDQRKIELRVGIIAVVSIIILIVGYAWLRNTLQLRSMIELKVRFDNAQGIAIGDKVTVNGMEAGRVTKISQLQDGVLIQSQLKLKYPIRQGAKFIIQDSNLMGGKQLDIINSSEGQSIDFRVIQTGDNSYGMTALLSTASLTMQQINMLLFELNKPEGFFTQVTSTFEETKKTFGNINETIEDSQENLGTALKQISSSATQLNELITQNKPSLDKAISLTPELMLKTQATLDSLRIASSVLQKAVRNFSEGKGTISNLVNDDTLYKNLLKSSAKLDSLLIDIRKNPRRYFQLKVF